MVLALAGAAACSKSDDDQHRHHAGHDRRIDAGHHRRLVQRRHRPVRQDRAGRLKAVGCYSGNIDGIMGPETDAAIVAFQTAMGLEVDGELGPETDSALEKAAAAGETVCKPAGSTTTAKPASTTTASGGIAPCTATAISAALPQGNVVVSYVCAGEYAAATYRPSGSTTGDTQIVLISQNGVWQVPGQDPCGSASAGIPPVILENGCGTSTGTTA
ncbi:MAG: peptidoglycan-binding domain-containing protein [Acidimicrobiales bacterium]